jgi:hypothetical protein
MAPFGYTRSREGGAPEFAVRQMYSTYCDSGKGGL